MTATQRMISMGQNHLQQTDAIKTNAQNQASLVSWIEQSLYKYEAPLLLYVTRFLKDEDRAKDVVQDAFLKLCTIGASERENLESHLGQWLYTVCRNNALNIIRKEKRAFSLSDERLATTGSQDREPIDVKVQEELITSAISAVDQLPPKEKECIELKFFHDMTYRQISQVTGYTLSYVGYLIHHGLKHLQEMMNLEKKS